MTTTSFFENAATAISQNFFVLRFVATLFLRRAKQKNETTTAILRYVDRRQAGASCSWAHASFDGVFLFVSQTNRAQHLFAVSFKCRLPE